MCLIPPICLSVHPSIFFCLFLLGIPLLLRSNGGQVDVVDLLSDLKHIQTHTCTAVFRPANRALQTIQPHWESLKLSLWLLWFHLSTHYPLPCWLNNTERKERGTGRKGGKVYPSTGDELPELLQAIIQRSNISKEEHWGLILQCKLWEFQIATKRWLRLCQDYNIHVGFPKGDILA